VAEIDLHPHLRFSILSHISANLLSEEAVAVLAHLRRLESLLIHSTHIRDIDISSLVNLRLVVIPAEPSHFPFSTLPTAN